VDATGTGPDQLDREGECLGRTTEARLHVHECWRRLEYFLAIGIVVVGVAGALDPHPHLVHQLDHIMRGVDPDVGEHALGGGELPAATIECLEAESGHDGCGEGIVSPGRMEITLAGPRLLEKSAELVRGPLGLRWGKELLKRLGRVGRVGGHGSGRGRHRVISLGSRGQAL
jgi:hypothetical protein